MIDSELVMKLAKVIIAAAWADGSVDDEELNDLKRLLLYLRQNSTGRGVELSGMQWAHLDMYIEAPVGDAERARLVSDLKNALSSKEERDFVVQAVKELVAVDGRISKAEEEVVAEIEAALEEAGGGMFGRLGRLFGSNGSTVSTGPANAPNREIFFDDFLRNKVYYNLARRERTGEFSLNLPESEQRKLGLAGGLMAKVARTDGDVTEEEHSSMCAAIQRYWQIGDEQAALVVETALATVDQVYDTVRMMAELAECTTADERRQFLRALFALAAADGKISIPEHEEIRFIARGLELDHDDFIAAKLQVTGQS